MASLGLGLFLLLGNKNWHRACNQPTSTSDHYNDCIARWRRTHLKYVVYQLPDFDAFLPNYSSNPMELLAMLCYQTGSSKSKMWLPNRTEFTLETTIIRSSLLLGLRLTVTTF